MKTSSWDPVTINTSQMFSFARSKLSCVGGKNNISVPVIQITQHVMGHNGLLMPQLEIGLQKALSL